LDAAVEEAVRDLVTSRQQDVLDRYREGLAHGLAATGLAEVRRALDWGQVDTLLLDVDQSGGTAEELVAAAAGTEADLIWVGTDQERLSEGVGAVLRYRVGPAEGVSMTKSSRSRDQWR
jgi:peptide subunit release factor 1 (eRF1)